MMKSRGGILRLILRRNYGYIYIIYTHALHHLLFVFLADFADAAAGRRRAPLLVPGMALKRGAAFIRPMIFCVMILLLIKIVSDIIL